MVLDDSAGCSCFWPLHPHLYPPSLIFWLWHTSVDQYTACSWLHVAMHMIKSIKRSGCGKVLAGCVVIILILFCITYMHVWTGPQVEVGAAILQVEQPHPPSYLVPMTGEAGGTLA